MQQFPTPPVWWESVTESTEPPAIPANSRNWRSFDFEDYDEEFWTREEEETMSTKLDRLKRLNRELVLSFASTLQAASSEDDYDVEASMAPIQEAFAELHKELGRLRVYEARENLAKTLRHKITQRRLATRQIRAKAASVLERLDKLLQDSHEEQQPRSGTAAHGDVIEHDLGQSAQGESRDGDDEANEEESGAGESSVIWIDGSEDKEDLTWLFRDFRRRGWKLGPPPPTRTTTTTP